MRWDKWSMKLDKEHSARTCLILHIAILMWNQDLVFSHGMVPCNPGYHWYPGFSDAWKISADKLIVKQNELSYCDHGVTLPILSVHNCLKCFSSHILSWICLKLALSVPQVVGHLGSSEIFVSGSHMGPIFSFYEILQNTSTDSLVHCWWLVIMILHSWYL